MTYHQTMAKNLTFRAVRFLGLIVFSLPVVEEIWKYGGRDQLQSWCYHLMLVWANEMLQVHSGIASEAGNLAKDRFLWICLLFTAKRWLYVWIRVELLPRKRWEGVETLIFAYLCLCNWKCLWLFRALWTCMYHPLMEVNYRFERPCVISITIFQCSLILIYLENQKKI